MLFIFSFFFGFAHAQQMTIWSKDPMTARKSYPGKNVYFEDAEAEKRSNAEQGYLPPGKRDALFYRIGFNSIVKPMDEMDKDLLVMTAHTSPIADLKRFYPKIKPDDLIKLKVAVDQAVAP